MMPLERLLNKYDFPKRTTRNEFNFEEVEQLTGFPLPDDYRFFLDNFIEYECFIGPECLRLWDADNLLESNQGCEIFEYLTGILAIGSNMSSECIGIEYLDSNEYRIILFPFIGMYEKEHHIEIGDSFTDMLIRLDNGKEWFE